MSVEPIRTLALDLGDVRIGLAVSDSLGITAQPAGRLPRSRGADIEAIAELVRDRQVGRIVIGYPLLLSGEVGTRARDAETFSAALCVALPGIPVILVDERLTTAQAERALIDGGVRRRKRREVVDSLAATLILQGYLDRLAARGSPA